MGAFAGKCSLSDEESAGRLGMRELAYSGGHGLESDGYESESALHKRLPCKLYCVVTASLVLFVAMCVVVSQPHERKLATIRDLRPAQTITLPAASAGEAGVSGVAPRQAGIDGTRLRIRQKEIAEVLAASTDRSADYSTSGSRHVLLFKLVFGLGLSIGVVLGMSSIVQERCIGAHDYEATSTTPDLASLVRTTPEIPRSAGRTGAGFSEYPTLMSSKVVPPKRDHSILSPREDPVVSPAQPGMEPLPIVRKGTRSAMATPLKQTPAKFGNCCSETGTKTNQEMDMWEAVAAELELQRQVSWGDQQVISIRSLRSPANPAGFWSPAASSIEPSFHLSPRV